MRVNAESSKRSRNESVGHIDLPIATRDYLPEQSKSSLKSHIQAAKQKNGSKGRTDDHASLSSPAHRINTALPNSTGLVTNKERGTDSGFISSSYKKVKSPSAPRISTLPTLEGLGTSPRIFEIQDGSQSTMTQNPPASVEAPAKPAQAAVTSSHLQSIHASAKFTRPLNSTSRSRNFDKTSLGNRVGRPWTDADVLMIGYLYEVVGLSWSAIDKKMGRGHNACATRYCRIPTGLKNAAIKRQMRWDERKHVIEALLNTLDLDAEQMVACLQHYIETESLPKEAAEEFQRLTKLQPKSAVSVSVLHDNTTVTDSAKASPVAGSDSLLSTIASTRPRRYVDGKAIASDWLRLSARLGDGQLDVKTMVNARYGTPNSVMSDPEPQQGPSKKQEEIRLFDLELDRDVDKDMDRLYIQRKKPYLSSREQNTAARAIAEEAENSELWHGTIIHQDFSLPELVAIEEAINLSCPELYDRDSHSRLNKLLAWATKAQLAAIAVCAGGDERLRSRTRKSIKNFLNDAASGQVNLRPERLRIGRKEPASARSSAQKLFARELGIVSNKRNSNHQIRDSIYDTMIPVRSFTGASGDIGNLAWSPSGTHFAAGAVCLVDSNSMQYNRSNNLLFGNIEQNTLYELPDHHRMRAKPAEGINATHSMHVSQDSRLFETVSMIDFSHDGLFMFSVGYDNFLRAFKVDGDHGNCRAIDTYNHNAKIDLLSVNQRRHLLATGAADIESGIKIFSCGDSGFRKLRDYCSPRAQNLVERKIMPSALKWGVHSSVSDYLMAGFSSQMSMEANTTTAYGELCLWNVEKNLPIQVTPTAGNTFDCSWSPSSGLFATACAAYGVNLNRGTKSLVRVYNPVQEAGSMRWTTRGLEMECPALDINDVLFNPYNQLQVAAGATDGTVYVWDLRNPDNILHQLRHGEPLIELDSNYAREVVDTGVRFCAWGDRTSRLYSGSSDGVLKVWDIALSTDDALIKDLATFNSGIMSGAFSNDHSKLLIGEVNGSINLLEVGADPRPLADLEKFLLQPFETQESQKTNIADENSGTVAAQGWLLNRKVKIRPLGGYPKRQAVQGLKYDGPYDCAPNADDLRQRSQAFQQRIFVSQRQCSLPLCRESGKHFSMGRLDDSGRSADRIPQAMRDAMRISTSGKNNKIPSTMLKCTHCGAPARVREDDMGQAAFPLCERCSFGCLRCGEPSKISAVVDRLACRSCGSEWDIGALGYALQASSSTKNTKLKNLMNEGERDYVLADGGGVNEMGDLLHLVEEYHHSLWEDRSSIES
jgi:WD40 repeat protein